MRIHVELAVTSCSSSEYQDQHMPDYGCVRQGVSEAIRESSLLLDPHEQVVSKERCVATRGGERGLRSVEDAVKLRNAPL